jgi:hypothetical protein
MIPTVCAAAADAADASADVTEENCQIRKGPPVSRRVIDLRHQLGGLGNCAVLACQPDGLVDSNEVDTGIFDKNSDIGGLVELFVGADVQRKHRESFGGNVVSSLTQLAAVYQSSERVYAKAWPS